MNILVALDGSIESQETLKLVCRLPILKKEIHLVYVVDILPAVPLVDLLTTISVKDQEAYYQKSREAGTMILDEGLSICKTFGYTTTKHLLEGVPEESILQIAGKVHAGMIAVGSRGRNPATRFLLGSVSEYVLRFANQTVLICRQTSKPQEIRDLHCIIGVDGRRGSQLACEFVAGFDLSKVSSVDLVGFVEWPPVMPSLGYFPNDGWDENLNSKMQSMLARSAEIFSGEDAARLRTLVGGETHDAAASLNDIAVKEGENLIVVGSSDKTFGERLVLGSVVQRLAQHASVPLIVVR